MTKKQCGRDSQRISCRTFFVYLMTARHSACFGILYSGSNTVFCLLQTLQDAFCPQKLADDPQIR